MAVTAGASGHNPKKLNYGSDIEAAASAVEKQIKNNYPQLLEKYPLRWLAFKLMEEDSHAMEEINIGDKSFIEEATKHLKKAHGDDVESIMADERYALASGLTMKS